MHHASLAVLLVPFAWAIVIRHDGDDGRHRRLAARFPATCYFHLGGVEGGGTGILVKPDWVLTAAHVAANVRQGDKVTISGGVHRIAAIHLHPGWNRLNMVNDIALIRTETAATGITPTPLYTEREERGAEVVFVGRGMFGNGHDGLGEWDRVARAATNRVDEVSETWLVFHFDAPPAALALEGISGPGDSGGPAYIRLDGGYAVAGVSSWQDNRAQGREGVYGVREYYARVSTYRNWLEDVITGRGEGIPN